MLFTDTGDYHLGAEGVIRHTGNICDLSDQVSHQRALPVSICIVNIHYATQTQWWELKTKDKMLKILQGRNVQGGKEQKNNGVFGMTFYFIIYIYIYKDTIILS